MRNRFVSAVLVAVSALLIFSVTSIAQGQGERNQGGRNDPPPAAPPDNRPFDPKDFSGYWIRNTVRPKESPPLTEAGKAAMKGRMPDYLSKVPTENNDPMYKCNPQGFPRLVWEENEPFEMVVLPNRILQLFQWERTLRELWLDG